ncbi:MAG: hypothetical protein R3F11_01820 [Verrucomicrobiales bacterium]
MGHDSILAFRLPRCRGVFCLAPNALADEPLPDLEGARVTIPYAELKSLWEAARSREAMPAAPPVSAALESAAWEVDWRDGAPRLSARFRVRAYADGWQAVPLVAGEALSLESAEPGGSGAALVRRGGVLCALVPGPGEAEIAAAFTAALTSGAGGEATLVWEPAESVAASLQITGLPPDSVALVNGAPAAPGEGGAWRAAFASGKPVRLQVIAQSAADAPEQPTAWALRSEALAEPADGALRLRTRAVLTATAGSARAATLLLPRQAATIEVESDDLESWAIRRGDAAQWIDLRWRTPGIAERLVMLRYREPVSPLAEAWQLHAPALADAEGDATAAESALFAIALPGGLDLTGDRLTEATALGVPPWIAEALGGADFRLGEGAPDLEVKVARLPKLQSAAATVPAATATTKIVGDGSFLTEEIYEIAHAAPIRWRVALPEGATLLRCTVGGQPAQASVRAAELEFALPAPGGDPARTKVAIAYTGSAEALDPVEGRLATALLRTDLFVNRLDWQVEIPAAYGATAAQGNVSPASGKGEGEGIRFFKELLRGEQPGAEIFYRRRDLE